MQIKITMNNVLQPQAVKAKAIELGIALVGESGSDLIFTDHPASSDPDEIQRTIVTPLMEQSPGCWSTTEYTP
jgi:hypothetical protein